MIVRNVESLQLKQLRAVDLLQSVIREKKFGEVRHSVDRRGIGYGV